MRPLESLVQVSHKLQPYFKSKLFEVTAENEKNMSYI